MDTMLACNMEFYKLIKFLPFKVFVSYSSVEKSDQGYVCY